MPETRLPMCSLVILLTSVAMLPTHLLGGDKDENFEGTVVTEIRGVSSQAIYTRKGDHLRIENSDKGRAEPINVVDLATQKLTIIYPHNSTFVSVDLARTQVEPGTPNIIAQFSSPVPLNQPAAGTAVTSAISPPSGFPTPPPMPSMPPLPNNPMALGTLNSALARPLMPPVGRFGSPTELTKTEKRKKIQGFDCTLYTISDRMETWEIWATPDTGLFPFRSLQVNDHKRRFGPETLKAQWVELLQKQSLFPLEAILRTEDHVQAGTSPAANSSAVPVTDPPQFAFKVDKIERKRIDDDKLFQPPANYLEIPSSTP